MKFIALVALVAAVSGSVHHGEVDVDSTCGGAAQCGTCYRDWSGITNQLDLEAGHYIVTPTRGAWSAWSSGNTGRWLWVFRFQMVCDGTVHTLGSGSRYDSATEAFNAVSAQTLSFDLTQDCIVKFGVLDRPCSDNRNAPGNIPMHFKVDKVCRHAPSDPNHGSYPASCVDTDPPAGCTPDCDTGYVASGPATCLALATQTWQQPLPTCEPAGCTGIPTYTPTDGTGWTCTAASYNHGDTCAPVCTTGNVPEANAKCEFGVWTTSGNCHRSNPDDCIGKPTDPPNGLFDDCQDVWAGATCKLTCDVGYTKTGDATCTASAYQTPLPTCTANPCAAAPTQVTNGLAFASDCSNSPHGTVCPLTCNSGYAATGDVTCNHGTWTTVFCDDVCSSVQCPSDPSDCQTYQCNRLTGGTCDVVNQAGLPCNGFGQCDAAGTCVANAYCKCMNADSQASCGLGQCTLKSTSRSVTSFSDAAFNPDDEFGAGQYATNGTHLWTNDQRWMCMFS